MTRPHPATDLRVVYRVPGVVTEELERLATARARRPSLRQIARATRAYQDGHPEALRHLLLADENTA